MVQQVQAVLTGRELRVILCDLGFIAGLAVLGYGISLWSQTAAICYAGVALAFISIALNPPDEPAK